MLSGWFSEQGPLFSLAAFPRVLASQSSRQTSQAALQGDAWSRELFPGPCILLSPLPSVLRPMDALASLPRNTMEALPACQLRDAAQEALGVAVIGIDEGQFVSWLVLAWLFLQTPSLSSFLLCWFGSYWFYF